MADLRTNVTPYAGSDTISKLRASADEIAEVSETEVYLGFIQPGASDTNEEKWSIMQILTTGASPGVIRTSFKWAYGTAAFNLKFDDYADFPYTYKKF